jgi:hypothetical protein
MSPGYYLLGPADLADMDGTPVPEREMSHPEFYFGLGSGDSREQQTFIGHSWCIVAVDSGEALQAVMVTETQHIITVR